MVKSELPSGWKSVKLREIVIPIYDKVGGRNLETLSITAGTGFVNQAEKFGRELSGDQYVNYTVIQKGDFSFNKGNSIKYPYGCIYLLKDRDIAAVPNVFFSFRIEDQCSEFFEQLFLNGYLNHQLHRVINTGVRNNGLFNLYETDFYNCFVTFPPLSEQQAIAEILTTADKLIVAKERLIVAKQKQKQWLMQNLLTGKIRLPGFNGEWKRTYLKDLLTEKSEQKGEQVLEICSVAVREGVINQEKHLGRSYAAQDTSNYGVVSFGDIVYTKSPTGDFPLGIVKQSQIKYDVAVSPLYGIYTPITYNIGLLLHIFFSSYINTNNYLKKIVQKGAKNTINVNNQCFLMNTVSLPIDTNEQQAIANVLTTVDREIELLKKELEQQKQIKKYLMQKLLTGKIRVKGAEM